MRVQVSHTGEGDVRWPGQWGDAFHPLASCHLTIAGRAGTRGHETRRASLAPSLAAALGRSSPAPHLGNIVELALMVMVWVSRARGHESRSLLLMAASGDLARVVLESLPWWCK